MPYDWAFFFGLGRLEFRLSGLEYWTLSMRKLLALVEGWHKVENRKAMKLAIAMSGQSLEDTPQSLDVDPFEGLG